jgi:hypothetical protein
MTGSMNIFDPKFPSRHLLWLLGLCMFGCRNSSCLDMGVGLSSSACCMLASCKIPTWPSEILGGAIFSKKRDLGYDRRCSSTGPFYHIRHWCFSRGQDPESLEWEAKREQGPVLAVYYGFSARSGLIFNQCWSLRGGGIELPLEGLLCHK